jgi:hypothetical protein
LDAPDPEIMQTGGDRKRDTLQNTSDFERLREATEAAKKAGKGQPMEKILEALES